MEIGRNSVRPSTKPSKKDIRTSKTKKARTHYATGTHSVVNPLFVSQRVDREEPRSLARGIEAEEDAHGGREGDGEHDRVRIEMRAPAGEMCHGVGAAHAEHDAAKPAEQRKRE